MILYEVMTNQQDILMEKIDAGKRVENYFPEFNSYRPPDNLDLSELPPSFYHHHSWHLPLFTQSYISSIVFSIFFPSLFGIQVRSRKGQVQHSSKQDTSFGICSW
jgi:hypothetical protein